MGKQWEKLLIRHTGIWDTWDGGLDESRNDLGTVIRREKRKQSSPVDAELPGQWGEGGEGTRKLSELGSSLWSLSHPLPRAACPGKPDSIFPVLA